MASLTITKKFTNPTGHIVANAQEIAYQEGTGGTAPLTYDTTVVSVKAKIDELIESISSHSTSIGTINSTLESIQSTLQNLDLNADNVIYDTNVTVKEKLDELAAAIANLEVPQIDASNVTYDNGTVQNTLDNVLDSLHEYVDSAEQSANSAASSYQNLQTSVLLAQSQVNQIQEAANDIAVIKTDYANINNIANNLQASLNLGNSVQVLTENAYNALTEEQKNNGSIYLLYNTTPSYMVIGVPTNWTMGIVNGSDNNAYSGKTVTLQALPNNGYVFSHWTNNIDSVQTTGSTLTITASRNIVYYAVFTSET